MIRLRHTFTRNLTYLLLFLLFCNPLLAQKPRTWSSADIQQGIQKLDVLGTVLYLAAHPDDENTRLIAWLANEKNYRTAYLSLTRGDGGQNLIGPELRERLGVIRTQELLQARKIDGGQQFFSRANDFGYSKHPDETFQLWDREAVLADVVWVIRSLKPDVIITRFNTEPGTTHGHHTASAMLAEEAYRAAGDPKRFPEQLKQLQAWQPKRLLWNTSSWFYRNRGQQFDTTNLVKLAIGGFNPLLGKSYTEIAAESRSMHKSQGFGAALSREGSTEYLKPVLGEKPAKDKLFSGINTSWNRVKGGEKVGQLVQKLQQSFNPLAPWKSLPQLAEIYITIQRLPENPYKNSKLKEVEELMRASAGLYAEVSTPVIGAAPGEEVEVLLEVVNRSPANIQLQQLSIPELTWDTTFTQTLPSDKPFFLSRSVAIPKAAEPSHPYWLVQEATKGMFTFDKTELTGLASNPAPLNLHLMLTIEGVQIPVSLPLVHKHVEPAVGELYQPFVITPPIMVTPLQDQLIFSAETPRELRVRVRAGVALDSALLELQLPEGWKATPNVQALQPLQKGEEHVYSFQIKPPKKASKGSISVQAKVNGKTYSQGYETIQAPHFPVQTLFPPAVVGVARLDLKREGIRIGYIMGAGDAVPASLEQVGYEVSLLDPAGLTYEQLKKFSAVMLGIRAFNTQQSLQHTKEALETYAASGGVVIIQYNTSHELVTTDIAPYAITLGRGRVTDEEAAVHIVAPKHPALTTPNKISEKDFEGWVQERGLYFAESWAPEWQPLIASSDKGEKALEGGLLVAPVGNGYYVYGAYSWFRQLPAGVPGAYRLLANLLALGKTMPK